MVERSRKGRPVDAFIEYSCTRKPDCITDADELDSANESCVKEYRPGPQLESDSTTVKLTPYATLLFMAKQSEAPVKTDALRDCVPSNSVRPPEDDERVIVGDGVDTTDKLWVWDGDMD